MARKARQRISYVLPLSNSSGGHRLGVNGLAVDSDGSVLYSGGRDGVICAWDLGLDLTSNVDPNNHRPHPTTIRQQVQAHTHWINDIALAQSNSLLLTASSDITVKCWRPTAYDNQPPQSIGLHTDYVKVLAVPTPTSTWVASGGLDRKINVWDLSGAGQQLGIDVGEEEASSLSMREKGSVYALAATNNIICSGGPESTVRVWDTRSGHQITKLVGHTDNIRDILVSQDGSTILTGSSDRTVKVWSTIAGRCLNTLTMHDASIWSLHSTDPDLSVFYSSDKNGLVAKTDTRNSMDVDEGLSVAICEEHEGVHKVKAAGGFIWTATSRPSINRWVDVNTSLAEIEVPENLSMKRRSVSLSNKRLSLLPEKRPSYTPSALKIPLKHMLRLSNTAYFPAPNVDGEVEQHRRTSTLEKPPADVVIGQPVRSQPDYTTEGQNGLIKHVMLNDRKRILTLDTAGEVVMWDLLKCVPIRSYGKRHLEDVHKDFMSDVAVTNWCTVNTRNGNVAVVLEENTCFDAEIYADELELDPSFEFKEDQRINLGKWVLRYLFDSVISQEIERDQIFRRELLRGKEQSLQRGNTPLTIQLPTQINGWHEAAAPRSDTTLRANGMWAPITPGIVAATPGPVASDGDVFSPITDDGSRPSVEKNRDYFSTVRNAVHGLTTPGSSAPLKSPITPGADADAGDSKDTPSKEGLFGRTFKVGRSFSSSMKKLGRSANDKERPAAVEEKDERGPGSRSSQASSSRVVDDNFLGCVQKIRFGYEDSLQAQMQSQQAHDNGVPGARKGIELPTAITPSLPAETPVLEPPSNTIILIQEEQPEAGGVADLFKSTVGNIGQVYDQVAKTAPAWLAEVLLRNQTPQKDIVKISFMLEPHPASGLPEISTEQNNRLNANRMLRARKILAYVAERIEPQEDGTEASPDALRPDEYLELWCQGQLVPPLMSLMTIRVQLWRSSSDIVLMYKANGKKAIKHVASPTLPPA